MLMKLNWHCVMENVCTAHQGNVGSYEHIRRRRPKSWNGIALIFLVIVLDKILDTKSWLIASLFRIAWFCMSKEGCFMKMVWLGEFIVECGTHKWWSNMDHALVLGSIATFSNLVLWVKAHQHGKHLTSLIELHNTCLCTLDANRNALLSTWVSL